MKKIFYLFIMLIVLSLGVPEFISGNNYIPNTVEAASPKLNKSEANLNIGQTVQLKVKNTNKRVKWSSSNKKIATVKNGMVAAKKEGTVNITAKVGKQDYTCKITVAPLALNFEATDLSKGQILELKLGALSGRNVKWRSTNKKIATVDKNGKIKGVKGGTVKIEATYKNKTYTCNVTVIGKEILLYSNDDIEIYYYKAAITPIDEHLYEMSEAPDEEFINALISLRVKNKMDRSFMFDSLHIEVNNLYVDDSWGRGVIPSNSVQTVDVCGFVDPHYLDLKNFKVKKISGKFSYRASNYYGVDIFSKDIK